MVVYKRLYGIDLEKSGNLEISLEYLSPVTLTPFPPFHVHIHLIDMSPQETRNSTSSIQGSDS